MEKSLLLQGWNDNFGDAFVGIYEKNCLDRAGGMMRLEEPSKLEVTGWKFGA